VCGCLCAVQSLNDDCLFVHLIPWIFVKFQHDDDDNEDEDEDDAVDSNDVETQRVKRLKLRRDAFRIVRAATTLGAVNRWWHLVMALDEHMWRGVVLQLHAAADTPVVYAGGSWRATLFLNWLQRPVAPAVLPTNDVVLPATRLAALWRSRVDCSSFTQLPWLSSILRLDVALCTAPVDAKLMAKFERQPFILAPSAVAGWRAVAEQSWTVERLVERFGDVEFTVQRPDEDDDVRMRFADFIAYSRQQQDESPLYVFNRKFWKRAPEMLGEWEPPALFDASIDLLRTLDERIRPTLKWLVIGSQRTGASWHRDPLSTSAWNTLLQGRKRWAIYPPDVIPPGVYVERDADTGDVLDWHSPSSVYWFAHVYPTLAQTDRPYIECIQQPNETIYVPAHWWHCVLNLDLTVAVTENFGEEAYADSVVRAVYELNDDRKERERHAPGDQVDDEVPFLELVDAWSAGSDALQRAVQKMRAEDADEDAAAAYSDAEDEDERREQRATHFRADCERVCAAVGISTADGMQAMTYGQNPVFIVAQRAVKLLHAKFVGTLEKERRAMQLLAGKSDAFVPLIASGLEPRPFVVTAVVPDAVPLRAVASQFTPLDDMLLAKWCAETVGVLRKCSAPSDADRAAFRQSVDKWRASAPFTNATLCTIPPLLVAQVSSFVAQHLPTAVDEWQVLHGDMNDENILVRRVANRWQPAALIDFGDSFMAGDVLYELQALYCSAFRSQKALMAAFAVQCGIRRVLDVSPCALMAYALVHPCDPLATALRVRPELTQAASTLESLAMALFAI
jgi:hypothetical protein